MNKNAIKNYAVWARVQLIEAVKQRAYEYEITEGGENQPGLDAIGGRVLTAEEKRQRQELIERVRQKGYTQVMEEAAYTWFNRFIALRFMEVNGYLPSKVRVFTDENGAFKPEIMKEAMTVELDGLNHAAVLDLLDKQNNEALYKYLLITQCNALNDALPLMFERIDNWTELLFPANLLRSESVLDRLVADIPEEDWTDAVQIIGWLYQYYNSELKDETFALLKKNVKITKERIPAATQLFTPDWIVRYMVENSLGRLWYEGHRDFDKTAWNYYLDEAEQEPGVERQLAALRAEYAGIKPEEIKVIDPCMGSGHILVYAFDVLMQIYTAAGWSERDAAQSILENNLYGLDIDERAAQLSYFAVMMKARQYDRRILSRGVRPHVYGFRESNGVNADYLQLFGSLAPLARRLHDNFRDAMEYGSIIKIKLTREELQRLRTELDAIREREYDNIFDSARQFGLVYDYAPLLELADTLARKYDVVVTNPPYMGGSGMSARLGEFVKKNYPDSKSDLFACFIERAYQLAKQNGFTSLITMESWMFLSSFESLRKKINMSKTIINMVHMPYLGKGGTSLGINFGTAAVITQNNRVPNYTAQYEYTVYYETDDEGVPFVFPTINERWKTAKQENFSKIPGSPVAYWVSERFVELFSKDSISIVGDAIEGIKTGDNDRFLRFWFEVDYNCVSKLDTYNRDVHRWCGTTKGGDYRKWYGNIEYVMNWINDGTEVKNFSKSALYKDKYHKMFASTWTYMTSGNMSFRFLGKGFLYNNKGPAVFTDSEDKAILITAFMNTKVGSYIQNFLNPTLTILPGNIRSIPFITPMKFLDCALTLARECVIASHSDWDSFETSWDFKKHPLV